MQGAGEDVAIQVRAELASLRVGNPEDTAVGQALRGLGERRVEPATGPGEDENDEIMRMLHEMIDARFVDGHWGAAEGASPDGNMKMLVDYSRLDWPIPDHKALIDYTLGFATEEAGFEGRGCRSFNQMSCLVEARRQFPDGYRAEEIEGTPRRPS